MHAADTRPVIIAYDGSDLARKAVEAAGRLLAPRSAVVVTVWEPGLAMISSSAGYSPGSEVAPDIQTVTEVDRAMEDHAAVVAREGAELARSAGLEPVPVAVADETNVPETIVRIAQERNAQAVVVGSRGLSGLKARVLGSTSQGVVHRCHLPVLVVRDEVEGTEQA